MRRLPPLLLILALAVGACQTKPPAPDRAALTRTAIDAAMWGMPIVSFDAMRQAFFRDAGAQYGDIAYLSAPADWKLQLTTPNGSAYYVYFNFNTKDGPVVLDVPPAVGAGLFGSMLDAWQVPVADVGPQGEDQGKGGKYLLMPPDYVPDPPTGYVPVRLGTYNGYAAFRAIPQGSSAAAVSRALGLVQKLRLYPLAAADSVPETRFVDISGKLFDGIVRFDASYYASLAHMVDEEPVLPRDTAMIAKLRTLGIEKGKPFEPDTMMQAVLNAAAKQAQATLITKLPDDGAVFWPGRRWMSPSPAGAKSAFTFVNDGQLDVDARALTYFLACAPPKNPGKASFYLLAYADSAGQTLSGDRTYQLHVPAKVPAAQFWALTIYDRNTAAFTHESPKVELNSYDRAIRRNRDGSVDLYIGPQAPAGKASNWVYTAPGGAWFTLFRFYGPQPALMDKTWQLPDIAEVK
jgi:hypothetical protein